MTSMRDRLQAIAQVNPWMLLIPATLFTFLFSGFIPIFNNNIYHTPILLKTYDLPQFTDDPFVQSLRHYSSGFWMIFAGVGNVVDVKLFLVFWLLVTHLAFLCACLHLAQSLGLRDNRQGNLFLLVICCSPLLYGIAVGGGGMMIDYFTHSELANASLLLGLSWGLRGRYGWAAVAVCITFFLNAFMAIWMLPPLGLLAAYQLWYGQLGWRRFLTDGALGSIAGSVFLIIPLLNILQNPELAAPPTFSYSAFLWAFFPYHFFLSSLSVTELSTIGVTIAALFFSVRLHGPHAGPLLMVSIGAFGIVLLAGTLPLITDSRMMLNLHLLRGFVLVAMLCAISLAIVVSRWLTLPADGSRFVLGVLLFAGLLGSGFGLSLAVILLLLDRDLGGRPSFEALLSGRIARVGAVSLLALSVAFSAMRANIVLHKTQIEAQDMVMWGQLGTWAKQATSPDAIFFVPEEGAAAFSLASERQLWFVVKYGAAVMWSPSYFPIWESRHVLPPGRSFLDRLKDAARGRIDYVAIPCDDTVTQLPVHRQDGICVYKLT
jgi:hypothetical protein